MNKSDYQFNKEDFEESKKKFDKEEYEFEELLELDYKARKKYSVLRDKYFNYHWKKFEEKLALKKVSLLTAILSVLLFIILEISAYSMIFTREYYMEGVIILTIILNIAFIIGVFILRNKLDVTDFNAMRMFSFSFAVLGLFFMMFFFGSFFSVLQKEFEYFFSAGILSLNMVFGMIVIEYLYYKRVLGPGEAHYYGIRLLNDIEKVPELDKDLLKDFKGFVKGLDDWCDEKLGARIENFTEFKRQALSKLVTDFDEFRKKLKVLFTKDFFDLLKRYDSIENLSKVLKATAGLINMDLIILPQTITHILKRNLGKSGTLSTIIGSIGSIMSILLLLV